MEMQNPYSIIFIFFCFFFVIRKLSSSRKPTRNLPPGPWKLPLIGNLHQLAGSLPHRSLTNLANKYGPFMHLQLGQLSHIIVSSPEYAKEIMKTHDQIFANRPKNLASDILTYKCTDIIFSPYGNYWRQLRKICLLELFSKRRVQSFKKIREEEVLALVRNVSKHEGSVMNLSVKIYAFMNYVVVRAACGKKTENVEHLPQIMEQSIKAGSGLSIDDFYPSLKFISVITGMRARVMKLHKDCDEVLDEIIREHKEKKGNNFGEVEDDLVDVLLKIQAEDDFEIHLSLDNIKAVLKVRCFLCWDRTSAATIERVMSELQKNPEAMKEAQAEVRRICGGKGFVDESELHQLKYLGAVIKGSFRLHPPGALLVPRENSNSCKINGYEIPPRTRIIINAWAIGRDHKIWNEPERFEPKRFLDTMVDYNFNGSNFEFIPFGAGRRICPGITFAIPTLELLLSNLLYHFDWKLPSRLKPEEMDMDESFGAALSSSKKPSKNLPAGPWKLPLIGNLHQLAGSLPHPSLTNLANKYGPFMHLQFGQVSHIIVSSPEYAKEIMKTHDQIFANRPKNLASDLLTYSSIDIIFSSYGNYWRQLRKICLLELFSKRRVQSFKDIREEEVLALVRDISEHEGSVMNLSGKIYAFMNYVVVRAACGKKTKNVEHLLQTMEESIMLGSGLSIDDFYPSLKFISVITGMRDRTMKLHKDRDGVFDEIIREHKEKKGNNFGEVRDDLVDVLLKIQEDNDLEIQLSFDNIKAVLKDVFFAGTEATATTAEWAVSELLKNPKAMKEAQAEVRRVYGGKEFIDESELHQLKYLHTIINETLRLHPPAALLIPRENSESCEINGYKIPRGTRVIINAWAIGRDPKIWNEPERFEPKRFIDTMVDYNFNGSNFEYIPFGTGRMCPGITFAAPVLELLLSNLLYHFDWKLPKEMKPEESAMDESFGVTVRRKNNLNIVPISFSSNKGYM
ncbi:cytochrome P450 71D10-like [Neltuma alba]|uniref:cytochrome P450 71D10-like n=1 Tax=Neltuma alba TaxID=207710 RepID=UPI0010A3A2D0|nr:cytochrome P450 71D10-like [Prosopis alba]